MKEETSDFPASHSLPVDPGKDKTNNDNSNSNNNNSFYKPVSKKWHYFKLVSVYNHMERCMSWWYYNEVMYEYS